MDNKIKIDIKIEILWVIFQNRHLTLNSNVFFFNFEEDNYLRLGTSYDTIENVVQLKNIVIWKTLILSTKVS